MEIVQRLKDSNADPVVLIEQHLDYSKFVREGFGTGDCIIIADGELHIIDYKHGRGVLVEAENNPQMQLYALGAMEIFDGIYDIDTVVMTIFQPRRENVSSFSLSKDELYAWAENTLKPIAELAYTGDKNVRFSKISIRLQKTCRNQYVHRKIRLYGPSSAHR